MDKPPHGLNRKFTDAELRADLTAGLKARAVAEKYGCSSAAVYKRINSLGLTTTAAAVAPVESQRFVNRQLDAMEQLTLNLHRVNLLANACDAWLRDADDAGRYDIGARSEEMIVTYWDMDDEGNPVRAKATLRELLARIDKSGRQTIKAETKFADPRSLILSTLAESRQILNQGVELARLLADAKAMEQFREAILAEIAKVSPDVAQQIAQAVRRSVLLFQSLGGPARVPAGGGAARAE